MLLGCGLALLAVFLLPAIGASNGVTLLVFFILMIACHLFMGHGSHGGDHGARHSGGSAASPGHEEGDHE